MVIWKVGYFYSFACFSIVVCILTRLTGSSKYGKTRKNTQGYSTPKRLRCYNNTANESFRTANHVGK